jgi:hypothetical protein
MLGLRSGNRLFILLAGIVTGLLCLGRPSFLVLVSFFATLILLGRFLCTPSRPVSWATHALAFVMGAAVVLTPWLVRNYVSLGKVGFTEEYGSAALIERFAFNDMTIREYALAFPYCVPLLGPALVNGIAGGSAMARFQWDAEKSFFQEGRAKRLKLVQTHGSLDAVMRQVLATEISENGLRHVLVSVPLAWCGMWVGGPLALLLVPLFWWACLRAPSESRRLILAYASAGFVMLGLHGVVANHYPRYNLILIGPFAAATAWMLLSFVRALRRKPAAP